MQQGPGGQPPIQQIQRPIMPQAGQSMQGQQPSQGQPQQQMAQPQQPDPNKLNFQFNSDGSLAMNKKATELSPDEIQQVKAGYQQWQQQQNQMTAQNGSDLSAVAGLGDKIDDDLISGKRMMENNDVKSKQQEDINTNQKLLDIANNVKQTMDPSFLTAKGRLEATVIATKQKAGLDLSDDEQQTLAQHSAFEQQVGLYNTQFIKDVTARGLSSDVAAKTIKEGIIDPTTSPTEFKQKLDGVIDYHSHLINEAGQNLNYGQSTVAQNNSASNPVSSSNINSNVNTQGLTAAQQSLFQKHPELMNPDSAKQVLQGYGYGSK